MVVEGTTKFGTTTTGIKFAIAGTDEYKVEAQDVAGNAWNSLHLKADGNDGLFIEKDTNNVGIGLTNPETKLDVNGTCTTELLQLKRQESTPSEPNEDRSIIFMDNEGDIKVMINVGGTVVTRTLATFDN